MRTLIIPCAGSRRVEGKPLYLNFHPNGELLAIKTIQGVFPENYDRIVFTILKEDDEVFDAETIINSANNNRYPFEYIKLSNKTSGPAETIYKTIDKAAISGEFAVRDSHAYIKINHDIRGNFIAGLDLTKYESPIENLRSKSFITLNEQNRVLDVVEKHFCSDIISTGLYGFKSADDYVMAYRHLNDPNYPFLKLYLSHVISYLIGYKQRVFVADMVTEFEDWSSKVAWQKIQKSYGTCLLDLDKIKERDGNLSEKTIASLQDLSLKGMRFIFFTSNAMNTDEYESLLKIKKINLLKIVDGCTHSKIRTLIQSEDELTQLALEV